MAVGVVVSRQALYTSSSHFVVVERRLIRCALVSDETHVVYWIGLSESPTSDEIRQIAAAILERVQEDDDTFIIIAEHISSVPLRLPNMQELQVVVKLLAEHREVIDKRVRCTVVQTRHLNAIAKMGRDMFLSLYQPLKPFMITEGHDETRDFVARIVASPTREK